MREVKTSGVICLDDEYGFTYQVAEINYIEREDESFRYEFIPNYSVISLLPTRLFQGIPGLDLDLKREMYVRENITPVFISERTPSENREDLWELLESCGMDYLNRLEWLIRTDLTYSGDRLYACRPEQKNSDIPHIHSISKLGNRSAVICRNVLDLICSGAIIETEELKIDDTNRKIYYDLFMSLYRTERTYIDKQKSEGIKRAVQKGVYKGRKRAQLDTLKLEKMMAEYEKGNITGENAAKVLKISRSTFIRRYREYKGNKGRSNWNS